MKILFWLLAGMISCRHVEIKPSSEFEFFDNVKKGTLYKFIYSSSKPHHITIYDPLKRLICSESSTSASLFTEFQEDGLIRICVKNTDSAQSIFSYKCPDPDKEILGNVGYIKDKDLVNELNKSLDKLIKDQAKVIQGNQMHYKLVKNTKFWSRILVYFEVFSIALSIFYAHRSFVTMFEQKKVV